MPGGRLLLLLVWTGHVDGKVTMATDLPVLLTTRTLSFKIATRSKHSAERRQPDERKSSPLRFLISKVLVSLPLWLTVGEPAQREWKYHYPFGRVELSGT